MSLTPNVTIEECLRSSWDERYYASTYGKMCFQLGEKFSNQYPGSLAPVGEIPDFPDIFPRFYRIGESRRIMSHQTLMMMKTCYMVPDPKFPDLDELSGTVRGGWFKRRFEEGEWGPECHRAFMDGDGLGIGFVQVGAVQGKVHIQHHPLTSVLWDRHMWNAGRSRFIAFVHHLPYETAKSLFKGKIKEGMATTSPQEQTSQMNPLKRVKVIEYYDMGLGMHEPTQAFFLNTIGGEVLDKGPNDYGTLPYAFYQHVHLPGMRRPVGRIDFQIASQEMRNALERYVKLTLQRGSGLDVGHTQDLHPEDLQRLMDGEVLPFVRANSQDAVGKAFARIPAQDVPQGLFSMLGLIDREMNFESGISDADKAAATKGERTLGELTLIQQGADIQVSWSRRQYAEFMRRLVQKCVEIGAEYDKAPIDVDFEGVTLPFNDPTDPRSGMEQFLAEYSRVNINEDELPYQDPSVVANKAIATWAPFLQDPWTNQQELRKRLFAKMGEKDPEKLIGMGPPPPEMASAPVM